MRGRRLALALVAATGLASVPASGESVDPRALVPLLRVHDFAALESRLDQLAASDARTRGGWPAHPRALYALAFAAANDPACDHALDAWSRARPASWAAQMAIGWRHLVSGTRQRGTDRPFEGIEIPIQWDRGMRAAARAAFERAAALAPRSAEPAAGLLAVALTGGTAARAGATGPPMADRAELLATACAAERRCDTARVAMLVGLGPRHGGSADAALAFAREGEREAPGDPTRAILIAFAHRLAAWGSGDADAYFRQPGVFEEAERVYQAFLAAVPDAIGIRNEYAQAACWAGRQATARAEFERIGGEYRDGAWQSRIDQFLRCREWALDASHAGAPAP
jgi:hypothetical protein